MRTHRFVAALGAAALAVGGLAVSALPATAAECTGDCLTTVTVEGPERIGIGDDWHRFDVTIAASEGVDVEVDRLGLSVSAADDSDIYNDELDLQVWDGGSWLPVSTTGVDDAIVAEIPLDGLAIEAGDDAEVGVRLATTEGFLVTLQEESDDFYRIADEFELQLTADAWGVDAGAPEPELGVIGSATVDLAAVPLRLDVPDDVVAGLGTPVVVDATITNDAEGTYHDVGVFPYEVVGRDEAGMPVLKGVRGGAGPRDLAGAVRTLVEETGTVVEFRKGGEWVEVGPDGRADWDLADLGPGESHTTSWRFTFHDPELIDPVPVEPTPTVIVTGSHTATVTPSPSYAGPLKGRVAIGWAALTLGSPTLGQYLPEVIDPEYYPHVMSGVGLTTLDVVEELPAGTPSPTATAPTTEPAVDPVDDDADEGRPGSDDEGAGDEDGTGDDEGAGAGDELARTGYDLDGQAMAAVWLLLLGALTVGVTLRRRREVAPRA